MPAILRACFAILVPSERVMLLENVMIAVQLGSGG